MTSIDAGNERESKMKSNESRFEIDRNNSVVAALGAKSETNSVVDAFSPKKETRDFPKQAD